MKRFTIAVLFALAACSAFAENQGTTARSLGWYDIRYYGGLCNWNGTTGHDDAPAIVAALAAASAAGGGVVYLPPTAKGCAVGSYINIPSNTCLVGVGGGVSSHSTLVPTTTFASDNIWGGIVQFVGTHNACIIGVGFDFANLQTDHDGITITPAVKGNPLPNSQPMPGDTVTSGTLTIPGGGALVVNTTFDSPFTITMAKLWVSAGSNPGTVVVRNNNSTSASHQVTYTNCTATVNSPVLTGCVNTTNPVAHDILISDVKMRNGSAPTSCADPAVTTACPSRALYHIWNRGGNRVRIQNIDIDTGWRGEMGANFRGSGCAANNTPCVQTDQQLIELSGGYDVKVLNARLVGSEGNCFNLNSLDEVDGARNQLIEVVNLATTGCWNGMSVSPAFSLNSSVGNMPLTDATFSNIELRNNFRNGLNIFFTQTGAMADDTVMFYNVKFDRVVVNNIEVLRQATQVFPGAFQHALLTDMRTATGTRAVARNSSISNSTFSYAGGGMPYTGVPANDECVGDGTANILCANNDSAGIALYGYDSFGWTWNNVDVFQTGDTNTFCVRAYGVSDWTWNGGSLQNCASNYGLFFELNEHRNWLNNIRVSNWSLSGQAAIRFGSSSGTHADFAYTNLVFSGTGTGAAINGDGLTTGCVNYGNRYEGPNVLTIVDAGDGSTCANEAATGATGTQTHDHGTITANGAHTDFQITNPKCKITSTVIHEQVAGVPQAYKLTRSNTAPQLTFAPPTAWASGDAIYYKCLN